MVEELRQDLLLGLGPRGHRRVLRRVVGPCDVPQIHNAGVVLVENVIGHQNELRASRPQLLRGARGLGPTLDSNLKLPVGQGREKLRLELTLPRAHLELLFLERDCPPREFLRPARGIARLFDVEAVLVICAVVKQNRRRKALSSVGRFRGDIRVFECHVFGVNERGPGLAGFDLLGEAARARQVRPELVFHPVALFYSGTVGILVTADSVASRPVHGFDRNPVSLGD
mmetsp:Transcript_3975/g.9446  ORF Transcript_3975/g.9446 Transcript_3975/m.9446 type:complete len:228 (+) Transcript_3975:1760-2443(+)